MPAIKVSIKWGKEKYDNVDLDTDQPLDVFRMQLFSLTGVPPERQKIMVKGTTFKDDTNLNGLGLKSGAILMLMGTAGDLLVAPKEKTLFVEDVSQDQLNANSKYPLGLVNLGNTCYLNATLQCMNCVPELASLPSRSNNDYPTAILGAQLPRLFSLLRSSRVSGEVNAMLSMFVQVMRQLIPRFAAQKEGHFMQQDANECWMELFQALKQSAPAGLIDQFFGVRIQSTMTCTENPDEAPSVSTEEALNLSCYIEKEIGLMLNGILHGFKKSITKRSQALERDAVYKLESLVDRLPSYLSVQFVRFFFKAQDKVNCKIRKDVKFPLEFDAYELCTPSLKTKLAPARERFARLQDLKATNDMTGKSLDKQKAETKEFYPSSFEDDPGSNNSGFYELTAVLTHRGSTSDSGHYIAWTKYDKDTWLMFDDDNVTPVKPDEVLKLSGTGGADWHMAYILLYSPKKCEKFEEVPTPMTN